MLGFVVLHGFGTESRSQFVALGVWLAQVFAELFLEVVSNFVLNRLIGEHQRVLLRRHAELLGQLSLQVERWLDSVSRKGQSFDDLSFWNLGGTGFDHHNAVFGTSNDEVEFAFVELLRRGERCNLALNHAKTQASDRAIKRRTGQHKCRADGDHGDHIRAEAWVHRQDGGDTLDFVAVALRPQWADWAIDQAADQDGVIGWAGFALDKA